MYQEFFSLKVKPFSISPDPRFLFLSERHKEAIAHLRHGLKAHGGFVLLTGEVGTGKTTICRSLLEEMGQKTDIAFILNPALTEVELLTTICDAFNIEYQQGDLSSLFNALTQWLVKNHAQGRHTVVLIDEAQHLNFASLEQLRLLTNVENNNKKLLQVVLIGQTELQDKLKQAEFRPLAHHITARYHLLSLSLQESSEYIQHRLNIAGSAHAIFDKSARLEIYKQCKGIPRLTNILCDRSLLAAYTQDSHIVTSKMVKQICKEIQFTNKQTSATFYRTHWRIYTLTFLLVLALFQAPKMVGELAENQLFSNYNWGVATIVDDATAHTTSPILWFDAYPQLDLKHTTYNDALSALFAVWGYQVDNQVNCDQGQSVLLTCYSRNISLEKLIKLNYPSVVRLENSDKKIVYAVLYKISDDYQLLINSNVISVTKEWFETYWSGDITLLWKAPFPLNGPIQFGHEGQAVTWLANQLNNEQGWPNEHKTHFDLRLLEQVSAYQREQGLLDDGVVGPRTLMPLMQRINPNSPRLQRAN